MLRNRFAAKSPPTDPPITNARGWADIANVCIHATLGQRKISLKKLCIAIQEADLPVRCRRGVLSAYWWETLALLFFGISTGATALAPVSISENDPQWPDRRIVQSSLHGLIGSATAHSRQSA
jgi:hypothetical protein